MFDALEYRLAQSRMHGRLIGAAELVLRAAVEPNTLALRDLRFQRALDKLRDVLDEQRALDARYANDLEEPSETADLLRAVADLGARLATSSRETAEPTRPAPQPEVAT